MVTMIKIIMYIYFKGSQHRNILGFLSTVTIGILIWSPKRKVKEVIIRRTKN